MKMDNTHQLHSFFGGSYSSLMSYSYFFTFNGNKKTCEEESKAYIEKQSVVVRPARELYFAYIKTSSGAVKWLKYCRYDKNKTNNFINHSLDENSRSLFMIFILTAWGGVFIVPHLPWHGPSVFLVSFGLVAFYDKNY